MRKINTLTDLKAEQKRLLIKKEMLEVEIKNSFNEIKHDFGPVQLITKGAQKVLLSDQLGIMNNSIGGIVGFLLSKVVFRNSGMITRLVVPFLAKNLTKNLVQDHKTEILGWLGSLITRFGEKKQKNNHQPHYERSTANVDFH